MSNTSANPLSITEDKKKINKLSYTLFWVSTINLGITIASWNLGYNNVLCKLFMSLPTLNLLEIITLVITLNLLSQDRSNKSTNPYIKGYFTFNILEDYGSNQETINNYYYECFLGVNKIFENLLLLVVVFLLSLILPGT